MNLSKGDLNLLAFFAELGAIYKQDQLKLLADRDLGDYSPAELAEIHHEIQRTLELISQIRNEPDVSP